MASGLGTGSSEVLYRAFLQSNELAHGGVQRGVCAAHESVRMLGGCPLAPPAFQPTGRLHQPFPVA
jgi:hypothetical protein